jgi:DNA-binding XRE family transcriptional regulator
MNAFTNVQIINGPNGEPVYVVIPYTTYMQTQSRHANDGVPHRVVSMIAENAWSPSRAWREYLGFTQLEVATRIGISQPAYAQQEAGARPRRSTREKIAGALGITPQMLDL